MNSSQDIPIQSDDEDDKSTYNNHPPTTEASTTEDVQTVAKRRRSSSGGGMGKLKKAPGAPRRFKSAFVFYSSWKHKELKKQDASIGEGKGKMPNTARMVAEEWKKLSKQERDVWEETARLDRERFEMEKRLYTGPWKVEAQSKLVKDPSAPKKPSSAYLSFANSKRAMVKRLNPEATNAEISRRLSEMWKTAPTDVRKVYIDTEAKLRKKYKTDVAEWKAKIERERQLHWKQHQTPESNLEVLRPMLEERRSLTKSPPLEAQQSRSDVFSTFWSTAPVSSVPSLLQQASHEGTASDSNSPSSAPMVLESTPGHHYQFEETIQAGRPHSAVPLTRDTKDVISRPMAPQQSGIDGGNSVARASIPQSSPLGERLSLSGLDSTDFSQGAGIASLRGNQRRISSSFGSPQSSLGNHHQQQRQGINSVVDHSRIPINVGDGNIMFPEGVHLQATAAVNPLMLSVVGQRGAGSSVSLSLQQEQQKQASLTRQNQLGGMNSQSNRANQQHQRSFLDDNLSDNEGVMASSDRDELSDVDETIFDC